MENTKTSSPRTFKAVCETCDYESEPQPTENDAATAGLIHVREKGNGDHVIRVVTVRTA